MKRVITYGEPPTNPRIGDRAKIDNHCCLWVACDKCGKERWVRAKKGGIPNNVICVDCTRKSPNVRNKLRLANLGLKHSLERITRNSEAQKGKVLSDETKRKISIASKGRILSKDTRNKISTAQKMKWSDSTFKSASLKRLADSLPNHETRISRNRQMESWYYLDGKRIKFTDPTTVKELRNKKLGDIGDIARIGHGSFAIKILCETCKKPMWTRIDNKLPRNKSCHSCSSTIMYKKYPKVFAEARNKWQVSMNKSLHIKPNQAENKLLTILSEVYPRQWEYVGDWTMVLAGKSPDFVNINGKKLIIELFGDYWHKNENPDDRISLFSKFGYRTLVVWEKELKNKPSLVTKIENFITCQKGGDNHGT